MSRIWQRLKGLKFSEEFVNMVVPSFITAASLYQGLKHVYGLDRMRSNYEKKDSRGKPVGIDEATEALISQVLRRRNLVPYEEAGLEFFYSDTKGPVCMGALGCRGGAYIGLPFFMAYKSVDDVVKSETLVLRGKTSHDIYQIDWEDPLSLEMANSLVLSEKAKMFLIAREIFNVSTYAPLVNAVAVGASGLMTYSIYRHNFYRARLVGWTGHVFFLSLAALVGGIMYTVITDNYNCWLQGWTNKKAAMLGTEYAEGGVELFESILNLNKITREMMDAADYYNKEGNVNYPWYRNPFLPITLQRDSVRKILDDLRAGVVQPTEYPDKDYDAPRLKRARQL
ncbi:transmembrane protein 177 [Lingula anatina]|uniref:Transmembrane protein 177 n=1 Tax=Lingula anatina TaxID=7574 RepID=A0A1S3JH20_LINAN|nr:transmembrane protein 177 [Lingula anatina]|eukprot:XP_013409705.1 transmembrane protein 177 [Lingula anatina]